MNNLYINYGKNQAGREFYIVGKDSIKTFGAMKAIFISVLADIDDFSKRQGNERFFATLESLIKKTGYSDKTIKKFMREIKEQGIIDDGIRGDGYDNKKFYKFNYERLAEIIDNANGNKNTPKIEKVKEVNVEVPKKQKSENKANECLKVANEIYENAKANNETERGLPRVDKQLWLDFVANKYKLMAKKRKELKSSLIETHFNELRILQEFNIEPNERLQMCIENDYLGLLFDKERERWRKQGKQFQKEVNFAKFSDNSKDDDDIWAGVEVIGVNHT